MRRIPALMLIGFLASIGWCALIYAVGGSWAFLGAAAGILGLGFWLIRAGSRMRRERHQSEQDARELRDLIEWFDQENEVRRFRH